MISIGYESLSLVSALQLSIAMNSLQPMTVSQTVKAINSTFCASEVRDIARAALLKGVSLNDVVDAMRPTFHDGRNWRLSEIEAVIYANGGVKVGMGATVSLYTDSAAYTVVKVSKSGCRLTLQADTAVIDPNFRPEVIPGGFVGHCTNNREQTYSYRPNTQGEVIEVRLHKDGRFYTKNGCRVTVGVRFAFHDYNF